MAAFMACAVGGGVQAGRSGKWTELRLAGLGVYVCAYEGPGVGWAGGMPHPGAGGWLSHSTAKFQSLVIIKHICQGKG